MVTLGSSNLTLHDSTEGNVVGTNVLSLEKEVHKAAKSVAHQWPGIVEADDLEQDIYLRLLESPGSVDKLLNEFDDRNRLNAIIQIGHQIAAQERTDYEVFSGNFRYSVNEVKRLLEDRALHNENPELSSNWSVAEDFVSKGGEFEDTVLNKSSSENDLRRGMKRLRERNSKYAEVIDRRYLRDEVIPQEDRAERTRLTRALTALTTEMNRSFKQQQRQHEGPGSRRAISNAAAYVKSNQQYSGGFERTRAEYAGE